MSNLTRFFNNFHHLSAPELGIDPRTLENLILPAPEQCAILLSLSRHKLPLYLQSPTFCDMLLSLPAPLVELLSPSEKAALIRVNQVQLEGTQSLEVLFHTLLSLQGLLICHNSAIFEELMPHFVQLNLASILEDSEFALFASLKAFSPLSTQAQNVAQDTAQNTAHISAATLRDRLLNTHAALSSLAPEWSSKLSSIKERLSSQHFSIGVSGVLSAGKSTFLNALLSQEVLGSSSVPETANLTILRYGEALRGRVHFWSKQQWEELERESAHNESLAAFIKESQEIFGDKLISHLDNPPKAQDIQAHELSAYTSANHPSKLCNLIQKVELFVPLAFLEHHVEIVDTPGLDDPITKREDITRAYLERCDMLIHVMNASCAATQVDIDFILESLLVRHVSRLLVVLTRVDLLTKEQLEASLTYTRTSLTNQLKKAHYQGNIQDLINRIDFIPLAGYTALLYRTNRADEAQKSGLSLQDCGITQIEDYLGRMLLGEDSLKMRDMLHIAYRATLATAQEIQSHKDIQYHLLNANEEELERLLEGFKEEHSTLEGKAITLQNELDSHSKELCAFLDTLLSLSSATLRKAMALLGDKLYEDFLYQSKSGKALEPKAIETMIRLGLKDCLDDIGREYKYKLGVKLGQILDLLSLYQGDEAMPQASQNALSLPPFKLQGEQLGGLIEPSTIHSALKSSKEKLHATLMSLCNGLEGLLEKQNTRIREAILESFTQSAQAYTAHIQDQITQAQAKIKQTLSKRQEASNPQNIQNLAQQREALCHHIQELRANLSALH